ncbi:hypothetical protein HAX54_017781 [Datura stramonium]|uniref:Uncharacterized protein n=1 Tax=Datura stramonium TaxID=4076 RepID=A0ABS8UP38_DATST|nr:hypothetical protein [Datura stramonium]
MASKVIKGKGVASPSHESKIARRTSKEEHQDVRKAPPQLKRYGLHSVTEQEDRIFTLGLGFVFDAPGEYNLNMVKEFLVNWMPKERMNGVTEEQLQQLNMDYPLSEHSRALCRVWAVYEKPLYDDMSTEDEMARVDQNIESSEDNEEDSEMEEASLSPTNDEE